MRFNNIEMPDWFRIVDVYGRGVVTQNLDLVYVNGMNGAHLNSVTTPPRFLELRVRIDANDRLELSKRMDEINAILDVQEPVPIVFPDEPDFTYYGLPEISSDEGRKTFFTRDTITIVCPDPYKYGQEKTLHFPSDHVVITNEGTAEADPIFELEVLAPITFAMVQNQDEDYLLIGEPTDDDVQAIDTRTSVLYENGSTLNQWQHTENREMISDDSNIDSLDGVMGTDDAGIRAQSYGTPQNRQRGPAIFKELSNPIQDFEIQSTFDIISRFEQENFRMMIYFLDENMNSIGHMGIKDNSRLNKRRVPLAQLGQHNQGVSILGDSSPRIDDARDTTLMYLRAKREGQRFSFYIAHWRNQRHETVWNESYFDINNEFQGRLKYITLFIGSYQDRATPNRLRINSVEAFELKTVGEDQTPYIAYPGDIITFDAENQDMQLNGEDVTSLKNFGAKYFALKKGVNELVIHPEESFNVTLRYRERNR